MLNKTAIEMYIKLPFFILKTELVSKNKMSIWTYGNEHTFPVIGLDPNEWTSEIKPRTDSNSLMVGKKDGKDVILFTFKGKVYRIDADTDKVKNLLKVTAHKVGGGTMVIGQDLHQPIHPSIWWLYDLLPEGKKLSPDLKLMFATLIEEAKISIRGENFDKGFNFEGLSNKIKSGLFFSNDGRVWFVNRGEKVAKDLTSRIFVGETESVNAAVKLDNTNEIDFASLPHMGPNKNWVSGVYSPDLPVKLLALAHDYVVRPALRNVMTYNKADKRSAGKYFIIDAGIWGKILINEKAVNEFKKVLGTELAVHIYGEQFEMFYTTLDIHAVFVRRRGNGFAAEKEVQPDLLKEPLTIDPEIAAKVNAHNAQLEKAMVEQTKTEATKHMEKESVVVAGRHSLADEVKRMADEMDVTVTGNVLHVDTSRVNPPKPESNEKPQMQLPEINIYTPADPFVASLMEQEPLFRTNANYDVFDFAMQGAASVSLPAPYGTRLLWKQVQHVTGIEQLGLNDGDLVSFVAVTLYRKGNKIYATETHVRLFGNEDVVTPKLPADQAFTNAVGEALKELSLPELLAIVSKAAM